MIQRRNFLTGLAVLVSGIALEQAIPFNRVWSFPKEIRVVPRLTDDVFANTPLNSEQVEWAYQDYAFTQELPDFSLAPYLVRTYQPGVFEIAVNGRPVSYNKPQVSDKHMEELKLIWQGSGRYDAS